MVFCIVSFQILLGRFNIFIASVIGVYIDGCKIEGLDVELTTPKNKRENQIMKGEDCNLGVCECVGTYSTCCDQGDSANIVFNCEPEYKKCINNLSEPLGEDCNLCGCKCFGQYMACSVQWVNGNCKAEYNKCIKKCN